MPKPPTRQTPTPRYRVRDRRRMMPHLSYGVFHPWMVYRDEGPGYVMCKSEAMARRICKLLNASRSKGKR